MAILRLSLTVPFALFTACAQIFAVDWLPVTPEDLALKAPRVEANADAEALFWDIRVTDTAANNSYPESSLTHYIRLKIFTERGAKEHSTVNVNYFGKTNIGNIAGRTIQPDGSVQELAKDGIFDRVLVKGGGLKIRSKSFAMPGVKPGSILEFQYKETTGDRLANYVHLPAQAEYPVERIVYHIKPLASPFFPYAMRYMPFNCRVQPFSHDANGYFTTSLSNIPAFHEEPEMPPQDESRQWILIYYEPERQITADKYWTELGKQIYREHKALIKVNGDVKSIAAGITAGANSDDQKIQRLYDYCRTHIKNISSDELTASERDGVKDNKNTADTLKQGIGTGLQINLAFAALAIASGFDARVAKLPERDQVFFHREFLSPYFLRSTDIAINVNGRWRFYDVANRYLPAGRLRWQEEHVDALIADDKQPEWVRTGLTPPLSSQRQRTATFSLDEQGTLQGTVHELMTGHRAEEWRIENARRSIQEREETAKTQLQHWLGNVEISDIKTSDPSDLAQDVTLDYRIRVPNYATRTGKRLFVTPEYFQFNHPARFTDSSRTHGICFRFPWADIDDVDIQLPQGYALDHADAPGGLNFNPIGNYDVRISISKTNHLLYHRQFVFGAGDAIAFNPTAYGTLKQIFDAVHDRDAHMLTLKVQQPVTVTTAEAK